MQRVAFIENTFGATALMASGCKVVVPERVAKQEPGVEVTLALAESSSTRVDAMELVHARMQTVGQVIGAA